MELNKQNAAPDVTVGAATGQHHLKVTNSITNLQKQNNPNILETVSMSELYEKVYEPRTPIVDGLLYPGLYFFVGAPKVGKSFFVAQLAYHVAAGLPLWDYPVRQGDVLYMALEDDYARLQKRLSRMFDVEGSEALHLATKAKTITEGLDVQMDRFVEEHPNARLIIIDTLQRIRDVGGERYSYAGDYEVVTRLKDFADRHSVCLMIVHHTRKMEAEDSFDMISGTNGLLGAADGAFVLQKKKRTDKTAVLSVVGRDQQEQEITIEFDQEKCFWSFVKAETELWREPPDPLLDAIQSFLETEGDAWEGVPTELLGKLSGVELSAPHSLTRKLNVSAERLFNEYGIRYESGRTCEGRFIKLERNK